ncbi:MAG: AmmeMemoRadiSam system protein B [Candidatus Gastranaerophilales bacterium]|nr:AmmeMemoRadiSam system protein B [Candidatus Gastranaerophilales bacterium]
MNKIKAPSVAGTFYKANPDDLLLQIDGFEQNSKNNYEYKSRAVIVPHAGLVYSGQLAYNGLKSLRSDLKTLFIFAPAHRVGFKGLALTSYDFWNTPLGDVQINKKLNAELENIFGAYVYDAAMAQEHSVEIQLPLLQTLFPDITIVPVLVGNENFDKISEIINFYYPNEENGFIISSDLSHFLNDSDALKLDNLTATMIESKDFTGFEAQQACGCIGILGLVGFAKEKNYSLIRIGMINSSAVTDDKTSVVGYGSWFLYEGEKNRFLKEYYSSLVIDICKNSIKSKFTSSSMSMDIPAIFDEKGASFVTLEKNNHLRGCIGSIIAHRSLLDDLAENARSSAFSDPRFAPVQREELEDLSIAVSLLSIPERMNFKGEEDLLNKITPFIDGLIIKDGNYQAVYLPSVWEQLPDKREFLMSLKIKAGLRPDHFSNNFQAYSFRSEYIKE